MSTFMVWALATGSALLPFLAYFIWITIKGDS